MSSPSPICTVDGYSTIATGINVSELSTHTIALLDNTGVSQWYVTCVSTDELNSVETINSSIVIDQATKTATFTSPDIGSAIIFKSVVNNSNDPNGNYQSTYSGTFGVYVLTSSGLRVAASGELSEGNAAYGWLDKFNNPIRNYTGSSSSAGSGLNYNNGVFSIGQNNDNSILVNTHDIQLNPSIATPSTSGSTSSTAISIKTGNTTNASSGNLTISSGNAASSGKVSGNINIFPGAATSSAVQGNIVLCGGSPSTSSNCVSLGIATVNPSSNPSGAMMLYCDSSERSMKVRSENGVITTIASQGNTATGLTSLLDDRKSYAVQTTNASPISWIIPIQKGAFNLVFELMGRRTDGGSVVTTNQYMRRVAVKNTSGTVVISGTDILGTDYKDDASWAISITAVTSNVSVNFIGISGATIQWSGFATIRGEILP
jgi:hypothetical protein